MSLAMEVHGELQKAAMKFGIEKLAERMGANKGTLTNKLNPNPISYHKPSLQDFVQVLELTGDLSPLRTLCRGLNGAFFALPDLSRLSDDELLDIVNRVQAEGGDVFRSMARGLADRRVCADDFADFDREWHEWLAAILELRARFRGMVS